MLEGGGQEDEGQELVHLGRFLTQLPDMIRNPSLAFILLSQTVYFALGLSTRAFPPSPIKQSKSPEP